MKLKNILQVLTVALTLYCLTVNAEAALHDRGRGLIYDDVLDITWTQDANLIASYSWPESPFNSGYQGFQDWRNPSVNELGYMFYDNLGGAPGQDLTGNQGLIMNIKDVYYSSDPWPRDPVYRRWVFCFSNEFSYDVCGAGGIGYFDIVGGDHFWRWAVRDGDVPAVVPEPISSTLLIIGGAILGSRRFLKK